MSAGALLNCAKPAPATTGSGGSKGSGGSSSSGGSNGSGSGGNNNSGGNTGSGGSSSSGGNSASGGNGSGGSVSSGGNTGSGGSSSSGSGGSSSSGGSSGSGGSSSSGGGTGSGGAGGDVMVGDAGTDAVCQTAALTWAPQIPTVFVLVDQSGSEFQDATTGTFFSLRTAALKVINNLQSQVRFGLGVFTGQAPSMCPKWTTVAPNLNNYSAINTVYAAQGQPQFKAETPAVMVLPLVQQILANDTGNGAKYILFATDSETDFCDDGAPDCPVDAVTYQLQTLYTSTPSIGTLVIGLPATGDNLAAEALQNYANAGAGLPVVFPTATGIQSQNQLYNSCNTRGANAGMYSWPNLYAAAGKSSMIGNNGVAIATYGAAGGNAPVYSPASTSETDLENQISAAINGVKACTFDLSDVGGKSIKVDLTKLAQASIQIEGKTIAQDATDGWSMSSSTTLVLNGKACTTWRMPNTTHISFGFPCSTIIFE